jgi:hypothetical protein
MTSKSTGKKSHMSAAATCDFIRRVDEAWQLAGKDEATKEHVAGQLHHAFALFHDVEEPPPPAPVEPELPPAPRPALLCRLIGHKWERKTLDDASNPGFRRITWTPQKCCLRCGVPNPLWKEPA